MFRNTLEVKNEHVSLAFKPNSSIVIVEGSVGTEFAWFDKTNGRDMEPSCHEGGNVYFLNY